MGLVTPLGLGVETFWQGLTSGKSGVRRITLGVPLISTPGVRIIRGRWPVGLGPETSATCGEFVGAGPKAAN
jgi:hypothetical protein